MAAGRGSVNELDGILTKAIVRRFRGEVLDVQHFRHWPPAPTNKTRPLRGGLFSLVANLAGWAPPPHWGLHGREPGRKVLDVQHYPVNRLAVAAVENSVQHFLPRR